MNPVVERALRALPEAGIGTQEKPDRLPDTATPGQGKLPVFQASRKPEPESGTTTELPATIWITRYPLAALCRASLEANPSAGKLSADERRWLAEHLEAAVLCWLRQILRPESAWDAACPKGHRVTDGVFVKVHMGWCCEKCGQVYPLGDCKLKVQPGTKAGGA